MYYLTLTISCDGIWDCRFTLALNYGGIWDVPFYPGNISDRIGDCHFPLASHCDGVLDCRFTLAVVYGEIWDCRFTLAMNQDGISEVPFLHRQFMMMGFGISASLRQLVMTEFGIAVLPWQ